MKYPLYRKIAMAYAARQTCMKLQNVEMQDSHEERLLKLMEELPHGSGIDGNTWFDWEKSSVGKLVFHIEYHCMNEMGYYDGWYNYRIEVTPSLLNVFNLKIVGKDTPNMAKDYLYQVFQEALEQEVE